jgi:hypothetical protein
MPAVFSNLFSTLQQLTIYGNGAKVYYIGVEMVKNSTKNGKKYKNSHI